MACAHGSVCKRGPWHSGLLTVAWLGLLIYEGIQHHAWLSAWCAVGFVVNFDVFMAHHLSPEAK